MYHLISCVLFISGYVISDGSVTPLGMKDGSILDSQITASTTWPDPNVGHGPSNARLDRPTDGGTTGAWSAEVQNVIQWMKADLGTVKYVSGIVLQGRQDSDQWVTEYKVQYSYDDETWTYVKVAGQSSDMVSSLIQSIELPLFQKNEGLSTDLIFLMAWQLTGKNNAFFM